jgi:hypothetical protein
VSGPCFSASVGGHPLRSPTRRRLGRPLPCQLADGTQAPPEANRSFSHTLLNSTATCGISSPFELLSRTSGQVTHALLTRSPLRAIANSPFDLHVLSTPPAFILSQDQTLRISSRVSQHGHLRIRWNCLRLSINCSRPSPVTIVHRLPITLQLLRCYDIGPLLRSGLDFTSRTTACQGPVSPDLMCISKRHKRRCLK